MHHIWLGENRIVVECILKCIRLGNWLFLEGVLVLLYLMVTR